MYTIYDRKEKKIVASFNELADAAIALASNPQYSEWFYERYSWGEPRYMVRRPGYEK